MKISKLFEPRSPEVRGAGYQGVAEIGRLHGSGSGHARSIDPM